MRAMNLRGLPVGPSSTEDCVQLYLDRMATNHAPWLHASVLLTAYLAWPNDTSRRNSWAATYLARFISSGNTAGANETANVTKSRDWIAFEIFGGLGAVAKPAYDQLTDQLAQLQSKWLFVADIFQMIVDMAHDERAGSPSISKAIELCELEKVMPGHSQLRRAWGEFRDVAHLLTAGSFLTQEGIAKGAAGEEKSILNVIWTAPDAVLALAAGYQLFGLQPKTLGKPASESKFLQRDRVWRIPPELMPRVPPIAVRRLTEKQLDYLSTRCAPKKYKPTTAPVRGKK
jgi:hypothetical protein